MSEDPVYWEEHCAAHKSKKKKKHKYNNEKAESSGSLKSGNSQRLLHELFYESVYLYEKYFGSTSYVRF